MHLRNLLLAAPDMSAMIEDFSKFSASVQFRDGDRYAVLDPERAHLGVALVAPDDHPAPGEIVLSVKVADVRQAVDALAVGGASVVQPIHAGGHELRALVRTPGGLLVVTYGPRA